MRVDEKSDGARHGSGVESCLGGDNRLTYRGVGELTLCRSDRRIYQSKWAIDEATEERHPNLFSA